MQQSSLILLTAVFPMIKHWCIIFSFKVHFTPISPFVCFIRSVCMCVCAYIMLWVSQIVSLSIGNVMLACVTFIILSSKCQVSAAARALLNLIADCGTVFSFSDKNDVPLLGQYCLVCPSKVMVLSLYMFFVLPMLECETGTQSCVQNHGYLSFNGIIPCFI